jgi:ABC-type sulfate transport system permease subunit
MRVASRRVIIGFVLQIVSVLVGISQNVYVLSSYFRNGFSPVLPRVAILQAIAALQTALHVTVLSMLLWAVHGAYRARGDVERFI